MTPSTRYQEAVKNVTIRILALYVVPMLMLVLIYPWNKASLSQTVFASTLDHYGFRMAAGCFSFVILTAAISTSNSGLYAGIRALYSMGMGHMAPAYFIKLNDNKVPKRATIFSIIVCWIFVIVYTFERSDFMYKYLLALSGFSGAIAWISICWTQYRFRKKIIQQNKLDTLKFKVPFFPYLTLASIWIQISCLAVMIFTPELRVSLYIGVPMLFLPMVFYKAKEVLKTIKHIRIRPANRS
jgi:AAT family amino acid transporter